MPSSPGTDMPSSPTSVSETGSVTPASVAGENARKIRRLLAGHIFTQLLATAARLGIFDALLESARTGEELSAATGVPARELRRCLRALEGLELVVRDGDRYRLAGGAELLSSEQGLFGHALLSGGEYYESRGRAAHGNRRPGGLYSDAGARPVSSAVSRCAPYTTSSTCISARTSSATARLAAMSKP